MKKNIVLCESKFHPRKYTESISTNSAVKNRNNILNKSKSFTKLNKLKNNLKNKSSQKFK